MVKALAPRTTGRGLREIEVADFVAQPVIEALDTQTVAPVHGQTVIAHPGSTVDVSALVGTAFKVEVMHPADGGWGTGATWSLNDGTGTLRAQLTYAGGQAWIASAGGDVHLVYTESDPQGVGPTLLTAPVIAGTAEVDQTLTLTTAPSWQAPTTSQSYVWQRDGVDIAGTTDAPTYTLVPADDGATITVRATATDANGTSNVSSNGLGPVTTPAPVFTALDTAPTFTVNNAGTINWTLTNASSAQLYSGTVGDTSTPVAGATTTGYTDASWALGEAGQYWVRATGPGGTTDSAQITVTVSTTRVATISYNPATTATLSLSPGTGLPNGGSYTIDWGDGSPVEGPFTSGAAQSHTFAGTGSGVVTLTLDEAGGPTGFPDWIATHDDWQTTMAELAALDNGNGFLTVVNVGGSAGSTGNTNDLPTSVTEIRAFSTAVAGTAFPPNLVSLLAASSSLTAPLAVFPTTLTQVSVENTGVTGTHADISGLTGLTLYRVDNTAVTGDVNDIPNSVTLFQAQNTATGGTLANLPSSVSTVRLEGTTGAWGASLDGLPAGLTQLRMDNATNPPTTSTGALPTNLTVLRVTGANFAMNAASVDNVLAQLDANGQSNGTLAIAGGNAAPTGGAANANLVSLQGKGWTVTHN